MSQTDRPESNDTDEVTGYMAYRRTADAGNDETGEADEVTGAVRARRHGRAVDAPGEAPTGD